jgi:hypothetical protein
MRTGNMGKLLSLDARGQFGYSGGLGRIALGYNRLGFYSWWCGIYQKKYFYGKPFISRMKFYRPTNPRTVPQQAWRAVMAQAVSSWQSLDNTTKLRYNKRSNGRHMTGFNLYIKDYLESHRL